ncbi:MAG: LytR/AlgR family response regulator transcription factor [Aquabacterium sp.]
MPTALIADDEPLLRDELAQMLAEAWPELRIVALARNGREAVERFEALRPDICFLDVHMPGLSGVEAAQRIGRRAHLVFVTAFDQYALKAFDQGALDYLVKPVQQARLADTLQRLQQRLLGAAPAQATAALLEQLAAQLRRALPDGRAATSGETSATALTAAPVPEVASTEPLRWVRASVGTAVRLIAVEDIDFLRSDDKYTLIGWRGDGGQPAEALIRTPLKELRAGLDAARFVQVHRSVVVNLGAVSHVRRGQHETADLFLKNRPEVLKVSRAYLHLFKQM